MSARSYEERIAELQKRRNQLKEQEKDLQRRAKADERKIRTRRLIEIGATVCIMLFIARRKKAADAKASKDKK